MFLVESLVWQILGFSNCLVNPKSECFEEQTLDSWFLYIRLSTQSVRRMYTQPTLFDLDVQCKDRQLRSSPFYKCSSYGGGENCCMNAASSTSIR